MPTACKSAPFGIEVTRGRLQPSRQPILDVKVIHRIAKLEFELLSIVHDHYGHELLAVTPMYIPIQGGGGSKDLTEACEPDMGSYGVGINKRAGTAVQTVGTNDCCLYRPAELRHKLLN